MDVSEFPGIAERNTNGSGSSDKILGFEFSEKGEFTVIRLKELKELLEAEAKVNDSEGLIAVDLKMAHQGILHFLNIRYDLDTLVDSSTNPLNVL